MPNFDECWKRYLQISYKEEPVGQRYIRRILLRMKFEVFMGVACLSFTIGPALVEQIKADLFHSVPARLLSYTIPAVLFIYFIFWEARLSSKLLAKTRQWLV